MHCPCQQIPLPERDWGGERSPREGAQTCTSGTRPWQLFQQPGANMKRWREGCRQRAALIQIREAWRLDTALMETAGWPQLHFYFYGDSSFQTLPFRSLPVHFFVVDIIRRVQCHASTCISFVRWLAFWCMFLMCFGIWNFWLGLISMDQGLLLQVANYIY